MGYILYFHLEYSVFLDALSFLSTNPAFPSILLYDRCKSGVFFARSRFRDDICFHFVYKKI